MTEKRRVKILEAVDLRVGRGIVAFREGWTGPVVPEAFEALIASGKAEEVKPKPKKAVKSD